MRLVAALALLINFGAAWAADPPAVTVKVVKLPEYLKAVESHKGKVVVVDMWADFCLPCKKEFPHLVELHQKYEKDGLICVSLSVDDVDDKDDKVLPFLKKQKATFPNFLLDEKGEVWQTKLDTSAPPTVFIYGKDGKLVRKFTSEKPFTYKDVEDVVAPLLKAK